MPAAAAAAGIGYPVIVKPRGLGASYGVMLAGAAAAVREAFRAAEAVSHLAAPAYAGGALIEEYLAGPEISIDGAVVDGRYTPLFAARKTVGMHPYFEELGHLVSARDELLSDPQILRMLALAHRAIEFQDGITHTEIKLTGRRPVIVEINGRLGGDLIPLLARFATGIEPGAVAVEVALGVQPCPPEPAAERWVGVRFAYPPHDCVVESVTVPVPRPDDGLLAAAALAGPGTRLELPPADFIARHAYVIATARDRDECAAALAAALSEIQLAARPLLPSVAASHGG